MAYTKEEEKKMIKENDQKQKRVTFESLIKSKKELANYYYIHNKAWIEFLNCRDYERDSFGEFDLLKMSESLNNFQKENGFYFENEKHFLNLCASFMIENLKAISLGESKELKQLNGFGLREISALISVAGISTVDKKGKITYLFPGMEEGTTLYEMARKMFLFLEYINELIEGKAQIIIRICPYKKKKDKTECGKVFVARWNQLACDEHHVRYKVMKYDRKTNLSK